MPLNTEKPRPVCNSRAMLDRTGPSVGRGKVDGETKPKGLSRPHEEKLSIRLLRTHDHTHRENTSQHHRSLESQLPSVGIPIPSRPSSLCPPRQAGSRVSGGSLPAEQYPEVKGRSRVFEQFALSISRDQGDTQYLAAFGCLL